jgi:hypothetical protein
MCMAACTYLAVLSDYSIRLFFKTYEYTIKIQILLFITNNLTNIVFIFMM